MEVSGDDILYCLPPLPPNQLRDEFLQSDSDQESDDSEAKATFAAAAQDAAIAVHKQAKQSRARNAKNRKLARRLAA